MNPLSRRSLIPLILIIGFWLNGCTVAPASLNPQSPIAQQIAGLWWVMFGIGTIIWIGVVLLLVGGLFRRRISTEEPLSLTQESPKNTVTSVNRWVVGGGIVMPTLVLTGLVALTVGTLRTISGIVPVKGTMIEVVGHQWWWEVHYPHQEVVTANEIHIPVGQPIQVRLSSVDVIHSFWVPELHGKFDLIPGQTTSFILQADQPGEYRGQCAEFCGRQHAKMGILVVAQAVDEFNAWIDAQIQPATDPLSELARTGQQVFLSARCVECHTVRGTKASGVDGPDLTHLASRSTLAAGTLTNTPEHLANWVTDPQEVKPGSLMPVLNLNAQEMTALLAYLESLK